MSSRSTSPPQSDSVRRGIAKQLLRSRDTPETLNYQELGLKLDLRCAAVETLVVDVANEPSPDSFSFYLQNFSWIYWNFEPPISNFQ